MKEAKQWDLMHITDSSNSYPRNVPLDFDRRTRILQYNETKHSGNSRNSVKENGYTFIFTLLRVLKNR